MLWDHIASIIFAKQATKCCKYNRCHHCESNRTWSWTTNMRSTPKQVAGCKMKQARKDPHTEKVAGIFTIYLVLGSQNCYTQPQQSKHQLVDVASTMSPAWSSEAFPSSSWCCQWNVVTCMIFRINSIIMLMHKLVREKHADAIISNVLEQGRRCPAV